MVNINKPEESFSFQLLDYEIEHQGDAVIDILVDLDFQEGIGIDDPFEYPDFIPIADFIDDFLVNYPNETDFWEILNKNLVETLLTESIPTNFGVEYNLAEVVDSLTVDIQVQPGSSNIDIPRSSLVKGTPEEKIQLEESFSFQLLDYEIEHQGDAVIDILVDLDFQEGIGIDDPFEYPDFIPIADFIDDFLVNYPNETDFWEILNKNLVETLLTESIPTNFGVEYNLAEVVDSLTVDIQVQPGSSNIDIPRSSLVKGTPEREPQEGLIDLRSKTGSLSVSVDVNREAAYDNLVGFYHTIFDGTFNGGSILAPFIVLDKTVDEALNESTEFYFSFLAANSDGVEHIRSTVDNIFSFEHLRGGDLDYNDLVLDMSWR